MKLSELLADAGILGKFRIRHCRQWNFPRRRGPYRAGLDMQYQVELRRQRASQRPMQDPQFFLRTLR